jgi:bile acid:Na+ symporter, BASS family
MGLTELLIKGATASVVAFVVSSTLGVGLSLTVGQIVTPLRNTRLIILALLANFVLTPLAALMLWKTLQLQEPLGVGLLLCGIAAGAPFLLKLAEFARGDIAFAVGLTVLLMVLTVAYVPLVLPLFLTGTAVDPAKIAQSLVVLMLIPLATGLAVRARWADVAARVRPLVSWVSTVSMVLVVSMTTAGHVNSVIDVFGTFGILAAVVFTALCAALGWSLGGPGTDTKGVLALATAQRNTAAAFVVAGQNFSDSTVVVMIAVVMIVEFVMLMPLSRALARWTQVAVAEHA